MVSHKSKQQAKGKTTGMEEWSEETRAKAVTTLKDAIHVQEVKRDEMIGHIDHTSEFVAARLEAENTIGAVLSMKQVLKYEALRDHAVRTMNSLEIVLQHVYTADHFIDYVAEIQTILSVPVPACVLTDKNDVLDEARNRLQVQGLSLHQAGARTA